MSIAARSGAQPLILGVSAAWRAAVEKIRIYARVQRPVVLIGPVGAGKTALGRLLHDLSGRAGRLIAVSGGEVTEELYADALFGHVKGAFTGAASSRAGALERAAEGTVLFDDLTYLPRCAQAALLRALEDRAFLPLGAMREVPVRCREAYATTVHPQQLMDEGRLLPDLFSRMGELWVRVPGLSERVEDVLPLALAFATAFARQHQWPEDVRISPDARRALERYPWPRNVRELRGVVEHGLLHAGTGGELRIAHLPARVQAAAELPAPELTPERVAQMVEEAGGNRTEAARRHGVHRNTISKYLRLYES